jgi:hypothetical protein
MGPAVWEKTGMLRCQLARHAATERWSFWQKISQVVFSDIPLMHVVFFVKNSIIARNFHRKMKQELAQHIGYIKVHFSWLHEEAGSTFGF